jgi:YVTN family beta-propeller protein
MRLIRVDSGPTGVAVNPTGTRVFVANYTASTVSVIDTGADTVIRSPITFGFSPSAWR